MWAAYADTSMWRTWAPQIRRVEPLGPIHPGMRGTVDGPFGARARFEVTAVNDSQGHWSWNVRVGPARLVIDHAVSDGVTSVDIDGPAPVVLAYAPVARLALARLVRLPS